MIFVISTVHLKPGALEACLAAARPCIAGTVKEDGCISYDVHTSVTDPDKIVFVERWESRAHLDAHMATPHMARWQQERAALGLTGRTITVYEAESGTPL